MERNHFLHGFSQRIIILMKEAGLESSQSKVGVKISALAETVGCSHQMARRYILGQALPDVDVTYKIAKWLKVSPGWLLFGTEDDVPNNIGQKNLIHIEPDLLISILTKSIILLEVTTDLKEWVNFIMDIIHNTTHIEASKKEILKIIDISISSAMRFNGLKNDNNITTA